MAFDAHSNFGYSTVAVAPVPALAGNSLDVAAGQGALFPAVPFNCTVWPAGVAPISSNAEIVRVTNIVGDTLTITRAQEGTAAVAIAVGYQIANTTSVKVFTDIENAIPVTFVSFISAGAQSASAGIEFANANGITFNMNAGTVTASHDGITQQSTQPVAASASNGSFVFSTLNFSDANGITFGTSAGGIITASVNPGAGGSINFSAGTTSNNLASITFANSNGITFGLDAGTITASHNGLTSQSNQAASASNGSFTFQTLNFSNANGITFGTSAGGIITASANITGGGSLLVAAGTATNTVTLLVFSNSNGITFGLNNSTITVSHDGLTSQSNQAASASNGSFTFQTLNFSNANGVTFGTSAGGIITASAGAGGAAVTLNGFSNATNALSASYSASNGVATMFPVQLPAAIAFDRFIWKGSQTTAGNITGTGSSTIEFGIYTKNDSTFSQITNLSTTGTFTYGGTANIGSNFQGIRNNSFTFPATTLTAGDYYFALMISRTNSSQALFPGVMLAKINPSGGYSGDFNSASNVTQQLWFGLGCYNTTAPAVGLPASIGIASISGLQSQFLCVPAIELINGTV